MDVAIRAEIENDRDAVYKLHQRAFGQEGESRLVDALRAGGYARLSLVAETAGDIVAHILFSQLQIIDGDLALEALALAPVAVVPEQQKRSIGSQLIRQGLEQCRAAGHRAVFVLGEPNYYGRFGFSAELAAPLSCPYAGEYFMALELVHGSLAGVTGTVKYAPPFELL